MLHFEVVGSRFFRKFSTHLTNYTVSLNYLPVAVNFLTRAKEVPCRKSPGTPNLHACSFLHTVIFCLLPAIREFVVIFCNRVFELNKQSQN